MPEETFGKKIKRALGWHWNLLALGVGTAVGVLSGRPDVVLPLVVAGEVGYLAFLGTKDRFQNLLRGKEMAEEQNDHEARLQQRETLKNILEFIPQEDARRFIELRGRAIELSKLQARVQTDKGSQKFHAESLDKLLWLYLKLLQHRAGIAKYLDTTDRDILAGQQERAKMDLEAAEENNRPRLVSTIQDKLDTIELRLRNYDEAHENWELANAEIEKTEQKIVHICEIGMTGRDPSELSTKIDGISDSVSLSQKLLDGFTLNSDQFGSDEPPALVSEALE